MWLIIAINIIIIVCIDVDTSLRGPCVVGVMNKFTWTAEVLWRKREGMYTL